MDEITYPLELNEVAPGEGATRLPPATRWDGLPEGVHTGGAWEYQGKVWKPLDARPYPNCEVRVKTMEAEFLQAMADAGVPYFPKNWEVVESNERWWLVREKATVFDDYSYRNMDTEKYLELEQTIRIVNHLGWTLGDTIVLAWDMQSYEPFILDCSSAWKVSSYDSEEWRVHSFFTQWAAGIALIRTTGASAMADYRLWKESETLQPTEWKRKVNYAYASFARPFMLLWASKPAVEIDLVHTTGANWQKGIPHTWIFSQEPIDQEYLSRYELKLCYFRWRME